MSGLKFLEDRWDDAVAAKLDEPELLRYRSNLLGSDLRITNFGGGNTSSKLVSADPITGDPVKVLWVKGSGGDLGSIKRAGFATLYLERLLSLEKAYKGVDLEDEMVDLYPTVHVQQQSCRGLDRHAAAWLPCLSRTSTICTRTGESRLPPRRMARSRWKSSTRSSVISWLGCRGRDPGFELGMMLRKIVDETPGCDGVVLGGHGLFTWGETQRESYLNTITIIDQLGQFIRAARRRRAGHVHFGGTARWRPAKIGRRSRLGVCPYLRGLVSRKQRWIGSFY